MILCVRSKESGRPAKSNEGELWGQSLETIPQDMYLVYRESTALRGGDRGILKINFAAKNDHRLIFFANFRNV